MELENTGDVMGNLRRALGEMKDGFQKANSLSNEDRRDLLTALREIETKAEAPRATITFYQNPVLDMVRESNTFFNDEIKPGGAVDRLIKHNALKRNILTREEIPYDDWAGYGTPVRKKRNLLSLGLAPFTDEGIALRANSNMSMAPKPEDMLPGATRFEGQVLPPDPVQKVGEDTNTFNERARRARQVRDENMKLYKSAVKTQLPNTTRAGAALGALASDFAQDSSRSVWWLINAGQATANLSNESISNSSNP